MLRVVCGALLVVCAALGQSTVTLPANEVYAGVYWGSDDVLVRDGVAVVMDSLQVGFAKVTDPAAPEQIGKSVSLLGNVMDFTARQDFLCVAREGRLSVLDFRGVDYRSKIPELRGEVSLEGKYFNWVHVDGARVLVQNPDDTWVVNISNPTHPVVTGRWGLGGSKYGIYQGVMQGNYWFLATANHAVLVYHVDPALTQPDLVHEVKVGNATKLTVLGNYLIVTGQTTFVVVDIKVPREAKVVTTTPSWAQSVTLGVAAVQGTTVYVVKPHDSVYVVDMADPLNPQLKAHLYFQSSSPNWARLIMGLTVWGRSLLISSSRSVFAVDVAAYVSEGGPATPEPSPLLPIGGPTPAPAMPEVNGAVATITLNEQFNGMQLALRGEVLMVAGMKTVHMVNVSSPHSPKRLESISDLTGGYTGSVAVVGDGRYAYIGGHDALSVVDMSAHPPVTVHKTAKVRSGFFLKEMTFATPTTAYVLIGYRNLMVLNTSNITQPQEMENIAVSASFDVVARGKYIYLAHPEGVCVYRGDLRLQKGQCANVWLSERTRLTLHGDIMYATSAAHGLVVISLADPDAPAVVRTMLPPYSDVSGVVVEGDRLYLPDRRGLLHIVDVSSPASPMLERTLRTSPTGGSDVVVRDGYAYIGNILSDIVVVVDLRQAGPTPPSPTPQPTSDGGAVVPSREGPPCPVDHAVETRLSEGSCVATACKEGYTVEGGLCVAVDSNDGLPAWVIALIVVGALAGAALLVAGVVWVVKRNPESDTECSLDMANKQDDKGQM